MISGPDKTARNMFQLFSGLHQQIIARWYLDWNPFASVSGPNVKAGVARTTMDCQKVQVVMKASEDGVFLSIFDQIRCSWSKEVRAASTYWARSR